MSLTNGDGNMVMPVGPMYGNGGDAMDSLYMALNQATSEEERRSIKQLIDKMSC